MAGFLDERTTVVDMVLTDYGRTLYSQGELDFAYYAFSDDEVDYDPYISTSGSLNDDQLEEVRIDQIEATLVREAVFGLPISRDSRDLDKTNIQTLMLDVPQGQQIVSEMLIIPEVTGSTIETRQQKVRERSIVRDQNGNVIQILGETDLGFQKFGVTRFRLDMDVEDFFDFSTREGFLVRVFSSGSEGLREVSSKRDKGNVSSYSNDLQLYVDSSANKPTGAQQKKVFSEPQQKKMVAEVKK
jgi:hypothetical protein